MGVSDGFGADKNKWKGEKMATEYEAFKAYCVGCERKEVESCSMEEPCELYKKALTSEDEVKQKKAMKYILVIKSNSEVEKVEVKDGKVELKKLQELVDGYIEVAPTSIRGYVAIVNEEGKLRGMEINRAATIFSLGDIIVGPMLILKEKGEDMECLDSEDFGDKEVKTLAEHACELVKRWRGND